MISQGITITLIGMSTVFALLSILVLLMLCLEKFVIILDKYFPQPVAVKTKSKAKSKNIFKATSIALAHHFNKK
ncbi:MAG: hypothetical protein HN833_01435 [Elusimicrobiaceae bacterium]|jgi:Na+-transporting methylmalonyl-CoA/oxaloacetate decarboxylase gamma subunit|nr:hypothetical protein [Elusimicrobiaceae bacterium]MBT3955273.1 hypothetical protein [Elusimicrobiaceae bacterium]MBT4007805.1 hypothetical protein [Elusimicrobiaceae bacterium]MBT4403281.1 hypothetical protein [Elusimicrobiaceae bacterium]MBT4440428.1 hypothetical protein [Elusimicrobiaceae bacterium]